VVEAGAQLVRIGERRQPEAPTLYRTCSAAKLLEAFSTITFAVATDPLHQHLPEKEQHWT